MPKIIYFTSQGCMPCKRFLPIVQDVCRENSVDLTILDSHTDIAAKYNIMSVPTVLIIKNDIPVWSAIGVMPKDKLLKEVIRWKE